MLWNWWVWSRRLTPEILKFEKFQEGQLSKSRKGPELGKDYQAAQVKSVCVSEV